MVKKFFSPLIEVCLRDRFLLLLISLLALMLITPLFEGLVRVTTIIDIFITAIFISTIYAVSQKKRYFLITSLLLLPVLTAMWLDYFVNIPSLRLASDCCGILFFAFTIIIILSSIFREEEVTLNVIYGAIVVYLLIGIMWSFIFEVIEHLHPGSFSIAPTQLVEGRLPLVYYSFVTITTAGYGDISPVTLTARAYSVVEAVIAQIYLVVLIARLVGTHIRQSMEKKSR
jgi:voltage-gated potassium channel